MFTGIWDTWPNRGTSISSCAIITTAANELVGELHDRMPAILLPELQNAWLDRKTTRAELLRMLRPFPDSRMKTHPVSRAVNSPDIDLLELLLRVDSEPGQTPSPF